MKTKEFGKLIAFALCIAMAFSMSATAFAAEPSEVNTDNMGGETIAVGSDEGLAIAEIKNLDSSNTITLEKSTAKAYYIDKLTAGQIVRIEAKWSSSSLNLHIGIALGTSTGTNLYNGTNGSVDIYTTVPVDGDYYLIVANPSTSSAITITELTVTVYDPA